MILIYLCVVASRKLRQSVIMDYLALFYIRALCYALLGLSAASSPVVGTPPNNPARTQATYDWCDCKQGFHNLSVWPISGGDPASDSIVIPNGGPPVWITWEQPTAEVQWRCDGTGTLQRSKLDRPSRFWSIQKSIEKKPLPCDASSGRIKFLGWESANYSTSVPFQSQEKGYFCIKIPVLLQTTNGTLLALAEARNNSCSDFTWTDLVAKSSRDGGKTWSPLRVVRSESRPGGAPTVIGNAAPVQLGAKSRYPGRILIPHTRNNTDVWLTYSDDDGETWSPAKIIKDGNPGWAWVGTGPPGAIQLSSSNPYAPGRVVVPSYHSKYRGNLINNLVHGHTMLSDDDGETWRVASQGGFGAGDKFSNENQAVELRNGSVLISARSFATLTSQHRIQTLSDDGGATFGQTRYVGNLPQPFDGCEGSLVAAADGNMTALFLTNPNSRQKRDHVSLWRSTDDGSSWQLRQLIDAGASGYSSLQVLDCEDGECTLGLLYEQSDQDKTVMQPDRFVYRVLKATLTVV